MWLWILATLAAFFIKGLSGFANTLVFTSILSFGANNINISPIELLLGYPTNLILTWKNRRRLRRNVYIPLSLLVLSGSIPGALLLKNVDARYIKILFGIVVILIGVEMLLTDAGIWGFKESKIFLYSFLGIITISAIKQVVILFPFMLIGLFAGMKTSNILDEKTVRRLVIVLLVISGIMLIVKSM